ncbi:MAG: hypothetical protein PHX47_01560 [Candidatus ainarchaeum sp.]|nr:hypothetical protein [Candidatus ainarchaeum sp.]
MEKKNHNILAIIGLIILFGSIYMSTVLKIPRFYVFFCIGYLIIIDFINYKLRKESVIDLLFKKSKIKATYFFIIGSLISAIVVDYFYGVLLFEIWSWNNYTLVNWIVLYTIINFCFILLVYGTYKIFEKYLDDTKYNKYKPNHKLREKLQIIAFIFLIIPLINYMIFGKIGTNYTMIFPFLSIWLFSDSLLLEYKTPILLRLIKSKHIIYTLLLSSLFLVITHEVANIFSFEWMYVNIPFMHYMLYNIPVLVFIGWIPLILFCISFVETYIEKTKKI